MITVNQLANELKKNVEQLLEQLNQAGIVKQNAEDTISEDDKRVLLEHLQKLHGSKARQKTTISTKETSQVKHADASGKTRTVQVEVKKKRILTIETPPSSKQTTNTETLLDKTVNNKIQVTSTQDFEVQTHASVNVAPIAQALDTIKVDPKLQAKLEAERLNQHLQTKRKALDSKPKTQTITTTKAEQIKNIMTVKEPQSNKADTEKVEKGRLERLERLERIEKTKAEATLNQSIKDEKAAVKKLSFAERKAAADAEARMITQRLSQPIAKAPAPKVEVKNEVKADKTDTTKDASKDNKEGGAGQRQRFSKEKEATRRPTQTNDERRKGPYNQNKDLRDTNKDAKEGRPVKDNKEPTVNTEIPNLEKVDHKKLKSKTSKADDRDQLERRKQTSGKSRVVVDNEDGEMTTWRVHKHKKHEKDVHKAAADTPPREISIPETISVADLAHKMSVKGIELIKVLMKLGQMVTINQILDQETAMIVVEEMGRIALVAKTDDPESFLDDQVAHEFIQLPRPPVVTVMGHVDHGKTSLLDKIRSTKVANGEAGGITQHIGAYHVETAKGMVTFLDTPGHEAFTAMRARGAKATDIVVLVVAGDDGVMPQTKEAIAHAKAAGVEMVVAINKMDKPGSNMDRVIQELIVEGVVPESYGGQVPFVPVSAKTGMGLDDLLETILLQAEVLELKAPVESPAKGLVIESRLDKGKGTVTTILVQAGTLKKGDIILVGHTYGRIRAMSDENGKAIIQAGPSIPVEIQGLADVPSAGDEMIVLQDERKAREIALFRQGKFRDVKLAKQQAAKLENLLDPNANAGQQFLPLIIKADVQGSQEALAQTLNNLSGSEVRVQIIHSAVGGISENDINLASASKAVILAFNVRADASAKKAAEALGVDIKYYTIIYDAVNDVKLAMSGLLTPDIKENILGQAEVRKVIVVSKVGTIAGCMVTDGLIKRDAQLRLIRRQTVIYTGTLDSLKRFKDDAKEVRQGFECGLSIKNFNDIQELDQLEFFEEVKVARTLA